MTKHPVRLETVAVSVTEDMLEAFEAALANACPTVGFFRDEDTGIWRVEGVKQVGVNDAELASSLAVAAMMTGVSPVLCRSATEADGWLARTHSSFPEQLIGTRLAVRGTHLTGSKAANRITLTLDAGLAFGSGEHGSTRGCMVALEAVARRRPRRILDMGTGSGILAMTAAAMMKRPVLATDIEPWAVRVAGKNAKLNRLAHLVSARLADGWRDPFVRAHGPYDLVFANILARPLCQMARDLTLNLAPNGTAILAGLLACQARWVLSAHRAQGLRLERMLSQGLWTTIVIRKPPSAPISKSRSRLCLGRGGVRLGSKATNWSICQSVACQRPNALSMRAMLSKLVLIRVGILKSNSARYRCKSHVLVDAIIPRLRMEKYPSAVFGVGIIPDIFFHGMVDRLGRTSPPISAKPLK